uniref:Uncharacterized protein n=1 Tax=Cucumis melo TaxID=3656 RepID=A0A9I9EDL1_CUCME
GLGLTLQTNEICKAPTGNSPQFLTSHYTFNHNKQAGFRGDNVDVTSGNECIFLLLISYWSIASVGTLPIATANFYFECGVKIVLNFPRDRRGVQRPFKVLSFSREFNELFLNFEWFASLVPLLLSIFKTQ